MQGVSTVLRPLGFGALISGIQRRRSEGLQAPEGASGGVGMGKVFTPPAITVCNEKVNRSYPQAKDGYPQDAVDKSGYPQGVVDCVDKSTSTYSLHPLFKRTVCDGVRG